MRSLRMATGRAFHSTSYTSCSESYFVFWGFVVLFGFGFKLKHLNWALHPLEMLRKSPKSSNHPKQLFPLKEELLISPSQVYHAMKKGKSMNQTWLFSHSQEKAGEREKDLLSTENQKQIKALHLLQILVFTVNSK